MNEKKCGEYADLINKVASGRADESETEELLLHAESCPECFAALEEATRISGIAGAKQTLDPVIKEKIKDSAPKKSRVSRFVKVFGGIAAAAAVAIVIFAVKGGPEGMLSFGKDSLKSEEADYSVSYGSGSYSEPRSSGKEGMAENNVTSPSYDSVDNAGVEKGDEQPSQVQEEAKGESFSVPQVPEMSVIPTEPEGEKIPFDVVKVADKIKISLSEYRFIAFGAEFDASGEIVHGNAGVECFTETGSCAQKGMKLYSNPYYEQNNENGDGPISVLVLENK